MIILTDTTETSPTAFVRVLVLLEYVTLCTHIHVKIVSVFTIVLVLVVGVRLSVSHCLLHRCRPAKFLCRPYTENWGNTTHLQVSVLLKQSCFGSCLQLVE